MAHDSPAIKGRPPPPRQLADIRRYHGWELAGISPAVLPEIWRERFREWYERHDTGDMLWLKEHQPFKEEPGRLATPEDGFAIGSFLVLGQYYSQPEPPPDDWRRHLARYARGPDYHGVLKKKAGNLLANLRTLWPDLRGRVMVDSAPAPEKTLAVLAGLGWMGKNTNIIHPRLGSYFFVTLIAVNFTPEQWRSSGFLEDSATQTITDHCGKCRRCLEACPTGALRPEAPYELAANLCVSYWTIEQKTEPGPMQAARLGGWAFGCDICQEVCPFNHRERHPLSTLFTPDDLRGMAKPPAGPEDVPRRRSALSRISRERLIRQVELARAHPESPIKTNPRQYE